MGKKRGVKNHHPLHGGENSGGITGRGGSNKNKFAVFDFTEDDERIEVDSYRTLSKFEDKIPSRKNAHHHHPVDKYDFLSSFSQGSMTSQHSSGAKPSLIDVSGGFRKDETVMPDVSVLWDSSNLLPFGYQNHRDFEYFSGEEKSRGYEKGTDKTLNKALCGNSNDGEMMGLKTTFFDLAASGGSVEEPSSEHDSDENDCEAVVVVAPNYVKYQSKFNTKCRVMFSHTCVRLEASSRCEEKSCHRLEWSINDIMKIEYQPYESMEADVVNLQFKSRDANVSGACNLNSDADIVELELIVLGDTRWSRKLQEIKSLDPKYEAAWKTVTHVNSSDMAFEDIIYPKGDPDAVFISKKDVDLLQPRTFINDTIVDFYIKYLLNRIKPVEQHRFHSFNSFFFRKLANQDQDLSRAWDGNKAFQRVQKWTRNVNLFEKDYILIPVNFSLHWSLIVICHPGKVANLKEKDMANSYEMPCILHMDSLQGSHRGFENFIRSYLWEEWKERHNKQEADLSVKFLNLPFVSLQLPQQENFFDCGLFLLHYAEQFLQLATNFSTRKYADLLNKDLFLPAEVSLRKRDHVRNLIYKIVADDVAEGPPAVCNDICLPVDNVNKGESSVEIVKETDVKDICCGKKFDSSVDQQIFIMSTRISEQQPFVGMLEPSHLAKSVGGEPFHLCEPPVSTKEEACEKLTTFHPSFTAGMLKAAGDGVYLPSPCPCRYLETSEMDGQCRTGSTSAMAPIVTLQNEEDCVLEVKSPAHNESNESDCSSPSSEILATSVADSEEENNTQNVNRRQALGNL